MAKKEVIRYSEAFKLQIVREIETGKYETCFQTKQAYGISGSETVQQWVCKYRKN